MNRIIEFKILKGYHVWLKFDDGFEANLDFKPFLGKGFTKELLDKNKFRTLSMEDGGGLAFYNGYDFCPNHLRSLAERKNLVPES